MKAVKSFFKMLVALIVCVGIGYISQPYISAMLSGTTEVKQTSEQKKLELMKVEEEKQRKLEEQKAKIVEILNTTGKLITYEGKTVYTDKLLHKGFLGKNELNVNIKYKFALGMDFNKINIKNVGENTVNLYVPKEEIYIYMIQYLAQDTTMTSTKTWLAKEFTSDEVDVIYKKAETTTLSRIANTPEAFENAYINAKNIVSNKMRDAGYQVVFVK